MLYLILFKTYFYIFNYNWIYFWKRIQKMLNLSLIGTTSLIKRNQNQNKKNAREKLTAPHSAVVRISTSTPLLLIRRYTGPDVGAVGVIVLSPGAPDVRRRGVSPRSLLLRLWRRLSSIPQVSFPQLSSVVDGGFPRWGPPRAVHLHGWFGATGYVPARVLIDMLLWDFEVKIVK